MNYLHEIYQNRWDTPELQEVGKVWDVLTRVFFQKIVGEESRILDIGCGFCHFLNALKAKEKIGVDANPAVARYAASDVKIINSDDLGLKMFADEYFDRVFISNLLEHLNSGTEVIALLQRVRALLKPGGKVIILQPNFRLLGGAYFDFIDHKTILTDRSVEEALNIAGFKVEMKIVRFLPYTTKSRFPKHPFLVRAYLFLRPMWYLLGKHSLFVAKK